MNKIPGDPLTGSLPVTHLVVPQAILGPARKRTTALVWPHIPDVEAVTTTQIVPRKVAYVRTRLGIRKTLIRVTRVSTEPGRNRGRHYLVGHNRAGLCRSYWVHQVISVESIQQALNPSKS